MHLLFSFLELISNSPMTNSNVFKKLSVHVENRVGQTRSICFFLYSKKLPFKVMSSLHFKCNLIVMREFRFVLMEKVVSLWDIIYISIAPVLHNRYQFFYSHSQDFKLSALQLTFPMKFLQTSTTLNLKLIKKLAGSHYLCKAVSFPLLN